MRDLLLETVPGGISQTRWPAWRDEAYAVLGTTEANLVRGRLQSGRLDPVEPRAGTFQVIPAQGGHMVRDTDASNDWGDAWGYVFPTESGAESWGLACHEFKCGQRQMLPDPAEFGAAKLPPDAPDLANDLRTLHTLAAVILARHNASKPIGAHVWAELFVATNKAAGTLALLEG
jgi:hypothetical protein